MNFFLLIFVIGLVLYKLASFMYADYIMRKRFSHIPEINSYPIIGTLQLIVKTEKNRLEWFLSFLNTFKEGIVLVWSGQKPMVFAFKPELLQSLLSSTVHIDKASQYDLYKPWLGDGLLTASGKQWHESRKLLWPTFHFNILEKFAVIMSQKTEIMIKRLEKQIIEDPGKAINIFPFIDNLSLDIICETAMGINVHAQETKFAYGITIQRFLELLVARVNRPWFQKDWIYYLSRMGKESIELLHKLHSFTNEVIRKKKLVRNIQNGKAQNEGNDSDTLGKPEKKAFLELLLDINEDGDTLLTDEELRSHVDTFMFAGQDTTSSSIFWALLCLGNNLEHQEKVHEELEEVFKDSQTPATIKEILQLKYLDRFIKEVRRLYPPVPMIMRKLSEDTKMGGYIIPKDTSIIVSILLMHRNPEVWPDPLKFDPDRFLPENKNSIHPYAYIPFSAGPRNCIGQRYAMLEEKIVLTAILRKWRMKSVKTLAEITLHDAIIMRPYRKIIHLYFSPKN